MNYSLISFSFHIQLNFLSVCAFTSDKTAEKLNQNLSKTKKREFFIFIFLLNYQDVCGLVRKSKFAIISAFNMDFERFFQSTTACVRLWLWL